MPNIVTANSVPDSWDETDTTKSALTNDLVEMKTAIVDGAVLGSNFIIYFSDSIFLMEFAGGHFIMNFDNLFADAGLINQNCVVEVEGKHYCFGPADIYVHDGTTKRSICDERHQEFRLSGPQQPAVQRLLRTAQRKPQRNLLLLLQRR